MQHIISKHVIQHAKSKIKGLNLRYIKNETMKFYKLDQTYYKRTGNTTEMVSAYKHYQSVSITVTSQFEVDEMTEITETQFIRVKKLILSKICGHE